jgi:hypothetical protein
MATITSISYLFRSSGGVIGISATSAIFQGALKEILTKKITGPDAEEVNIFKYCSSWFHACNPLFLLLQIIEIARKSMTEVRSLLPPDPLAIVLDTYQIAVRYSFYFCVLVSVLCIVSTLFIQQFQLHTKVK